MSKPYSVVVERHMRLLYESLSEKDRRRYATFQNFQDQCSRKGFELDLGIHLKNLVAFATGQSRFLTINTVPVASLQKAWKESVKAMEFALNFLSSNVGIKSPALLASPFLLVTV